MQNHNQILSFEELGTRELMKGDVAWWIGLIIVVGTAIKEYIESQT